MKEYKTYVTTIFDQCVILGVFRDEHGNIEEQIFKTNLSAVRYGHENGYKLAEKSASYAQFKGQ